MDTFARELWRRMETLHTVTYFAPESLEAAAELGVRGFWRTYFGFRAAPLGRCSAGAVTAAFNGFAPSMVARAIPSVWDLAAPQQLLDARSTSATAALRRLAGPELEQALADGWILDVFGGTIAHGSAGGRPLFAANLDVVAPDDPVGALWRYATLVREHRGDGHVAVWLATGLNPLEAAALFVADGGTELDALKPHRGWTDAEWAAAEESLERRGLVVHGGPTDAGRALRADVESTTDALAAAPFDQLDRSDRERLLAVLEPAARAITRSGMIPAVNPIGFRLLDGSAPTR